MENSRIFWIFVFIGFLCVVIFYLQSKVKDINIFKKSLNTPPAHVIESFNSSGTSSSTTTTTTSTTVATIPQKQNIGIYINAFLDVKGANLTYQSSAWEDVYNPSTIIFKFNTGIPPQVLTKTGFPTKSIALWGPSSENIAGSNKILGSFTISFYMKTAQILTFPRDTQNEPQDIELLKIFMETPYYVLFYVTPNKTTSTNININAHVGNSVYTWSIPASSIVTGNMFSFVVDATIKDNQPTMTFYINSTNMNITAPPTIASMTTIYTQKLILGVSQMIINNGGYLDASLWAFIYYNSILSPTDIESLFTYFTQQQNNYANLQALLEKEKADAAAAAANAAKAAATAATNLNNKLDQCNNLVSTLQSQNSISNVSKSKPKQDWSIDAGPVSYSDKSAGTSTSTTAATEAAKTAAAATATTTAAAKTAAAATATTTAAAATATTTAAAKTAAATTTAATSKTAAATKITTIKYPDTFTDLTSAPSVPLNSVQYAPLTTSTNAYQKSSSTNYASPTSSSFDFGSLIQDAFNF